MMQRKIQEKTYNLMNISKINLVRNLPKIKKAMIYYSTLDRSYFGLSMRSLENCSSHRKLEDDGSTSA